MTLSVGQKQLFDHRSCFVVVRRAAPDFDEATSSVDTRTGGIRSRKAMDRLMEEGRTSFVNAHRFVKLYPKC